MLTIFWILLAPWLYHRYSSGANFLLSFVVVHPLDAFINNNYFSDLSPKWLKVWKNDMSQLLSGDPSAWALPIHIEVRSIIRYIQNRVDLLINMRLKKPGFVRYHQSHSVPFLWLQILWPTMKHCFDPIGYVA